MCLGALLACRCADLVCLMLVEARRCQILGTGDTDTCKLPCRCLESNLDPLSERAVLKC